MDIFEKLAGSEALRVHRPRMTNGTLAKPDHLLNWVSSDKRVKLVIG